MPSQAAAVLYKVLDILVRRRRNKHAAKKFFRTLLKGLLYVPRVVITDKLKSYGAAKREHPAWCGAPPEPLPQQLDKTCLRESCFAWITFWAQNYGCSWLMTSPGRDAPAACC